MTSDREAFLSQAETLRPQLESGIELLSTKEESLVFSMLTAVADLKLIEKQMPNRDDSTAQAVEALETKSSLLSQIVTGMVSRNTAFQVRFDEGLVQVAELKVKAFTHFSSYFEKLTILGIGSIGLSITLLGFLISRVTPARPLSFVGFAIGSWISLLLSIVIAANGQLEFTRMSHTLLHKVSDMVGDKLIKDSARAYRQEEPVKQSASASSRTSSAQSNSEERSLVWRQSEKHAKQAAYATALMAFGYLLLLVFISCNVRLILR